MRRNKSLRKSRGKKRMRGGQNNNLYAPPSNSVITNGVVASNAANNVGNKNSNVGNSGISSNVSNVAQPTAEPENTSFFGNLFGFANKTKKQVTDITQSMSDQATIAELKAKKNLQKATERANGFLASLFGGSRRRYKHKKRHHKTKKSKRHGRKTHRKH
jgi:hypothetical protein